MRRRRTGPNVRSHADDEPYPIWIQVVALAVILAPTVALLLSRRRLGRMNTAAALVVWGALAASGEHGMWAMRLAIHERAWSAPHATVHYFMAGVYAGIAGVLLSVIALTLLREHRRSGWFTVLFVLLVGGTLELTMNGPTGYLYHHRPPRLRRRLARCAGALRSNRPSERRRRGHPCPRAMGWRAAERALRRP